jgi:hypothetical protein
MLIGVKMKKTIINFTILTIIILIIGVYIHKMMSSFSLTMHDIPKPKVIVQKEIVVKGKVIVKDKPMPYVITLKEYEPDEWGFDIDKSLLPDGMQVDSVTTHKRFDYLAPIRLGYSINDAGKYNPTLAYNPISLKSLEIGVITDFASVGVDLGIRYRNVGLNGYYMANQTYGVGLMVKVF